MFPGYLNESEEKPPHFLEIYRDQVKKRYYRTGDYARELRNGELIFLERNDDQYKISGYRVSGKEIEGVIKEAAGGNHVFVFCIENPIHEMRELFAIIEGDATLLPTVKERLKKCLPFYMIPKHYLFLDSIPQTLNGKVDKKTLKDMAMKKCFGLEEMKNK